MYKRIIIILGSAISLLSLLSLIVMSNSSVDSNYESFSEEQKASILDTSSADTQITYTTSKSTKPIVKKSSNAAPSKREHTPTSSSTIVSRAQIPGYKIIIDDPNINSYAKEEQIAGYVKIEANMNNRHFSLKVPKSSIQNYSDAISIEVTNTKTGEVQRVPASFLPEVATGASTLKNTITIDKDNISDIQHTQKNSILPSP